METMTNEMPTEVATTEKKGTTRKTATGAKAPAKRPSATAKAKLTAATASTKPANGRSRVVVEGVTPQIDGGRFAVKRVVGDQVRVEADVFGDGHDLVRAHLLYRHTRETEWRSEEMTALGNDHWAASFAVEQMGFYEYTVVGEVDHFLTWRSELKKRRGCGTGPRSAAEDRRAADRGGRKARHEGRGSAVAGVCGEGACRFSGSGLR